MRKRRVVQKPNSAPRLRYVTAMALALALAFLGATFGAPTVRATSDSLPGGTSIEVTIDDPVSSTEFEIPVDQATIDVIVTGTASVGEGVATPDTTLIYVLDASGSTASPSGGDCGPDQNPVDPESLEDEVIDCEIAAAINLNDQAIAMGSVDEVAMIIFAGDAVTADATPAGGDDPIIHPAADANLNLVNDANEVLQSIDVAEFLGEASGFNEFTVKPTPDIFGTDFADAISEALSIATLATNPNVLVAFLSDGFGGTGATVASVLPSAAGEIFYTFAVGTGSSCTYDPLGKGSLQDIADLTGGTCTGVPDPSKLPDILPELIGSTLLSLEIEVDGGGVSPISNDDIDPDLPQDGPASVDYEVTVPGLGAGDHEICVTAHGSDAGGSGSVTECVTIHLVQRVPIDIKPGSFPNSINTKSRGKIPVAILSTPGFDAPATVDRSTLTFGRTGYEDSLAFCSNSAEDVNGDGLLDLVCHFYTQETGFVEGDTVGILRGMTIAGMPILGIDSVRIVH